MALQWCKAVARLIAGAFACWIPSFIHHTMGILNDEEAPDRSRRGEALFAERRDHGIKQRQRNGGADTAQHGAARNMFASDEYHGRVSVSAADCNIGTADCRI